MRRQLLASAVLVALVVGATGCDDGADPPPTAGDRSASATTDAPASTEERQSSGLRLGDWCDLGPGKEPLPDEVTFDQATAGGLEACPRVQEMIGLDEQSAIDMLEEAGWPNRTIYRDVPLDFEENRIASRVSLVVVEGEVVDARWM